MFAQILMQRQLTQNESLAYLHVCNYVASYSEMMTQTIQKIVDHNRTEEQRDATSDQNNSPPKGTGPTKHGKVPRQTRVRENLPPINPEATGGSSNLDSSG